MKKISLWQRLLDLLAPRLCTVCGRRLSLSERVLCASCNMHLPRTGFQLNASDNMMARLFWGIIPVERAAALFYYEASSKDSNIIYDLKYHNHPEIGQVMGRMMALEFMPSGFFEGINGIVPVPLARKRQRQRGYNQSEMIAEGIREATGIPIYNKVVSRSAFLESQTHLGRWDRNDNVEGIFQLIGDGSYIRGKHLLMVDDVVTTGATVVACGQELLKAGDVRLSVL